MKRFQFMTSTSPLSSPRRLFRTLSAAILFSSLLWGTLSVFSQGGSSVRTDSSGIIDLESVRESAKNSETTPESFSGIPLPSNAANSTSPRASAELPTEPSDALTASPGIPPQTVHDDEDSPESFSPLKTLLGGPSEWTSSEGILSSAKIALFMTVLAIVPAILIMTTCYVRIITVLSILRQGLGTGQIPSTQILAAISLFLTLLVMMPTWTRVYEEAILPYSKQEISAEKAFERGELPIRTFLWKQIEKTQNTESIWLFMSYIPDAEKPKHYEDIPWRALLPAFMLSELKTAFLIGFQLFLPFLIIDLVVSGIMVSMGMMMLPPTIVSLPFKLMLFVLLDGWTLVVKMLLDSFTMTG